MRHVPDEERRARLARRHGVCPVRRASGVEAAVRAVTVLHATEPATVYLSLLARVDDLTVADVAGALHDRRTLVKQLAMRRTLFVFPRDLVPAALGSASARVAGQLRRRLVKELERGGLADDGEAFLRAAAAAVDARLAGEPTGVGAQQLRADLPELAGEVVVAPGTAYGGPQPIAGRVLSQLGVEGRIVRGENGGHWRISRPRWVRTADWLGAPPEPLAAAAGWAELVRRWLRSFGPGTTDDLVWWLGATKGIVRTALADVAAVQVRLDGPVAHGWVLPDDVEPVADGEPWAALLPVLDPTVMGWKHRAWLLGDHADRIFDRNGNAGTSAWWDGRVVGCWVQDAEGRVEVSTLQALPAQAHRALQVEAERLTAWLAGTRVGTVYPSPAMKAARH